jgi:hypothetical protein
MKKFVRLSIILSMLVVLLIGASSGSAALQTYNSGFQVQNLESAQAAITITFFDRNGTQALQVNDTVAANTSNTYFPLENLGGDPNNDVPAGFDGSVVISSDKKVAAITNVLGSDGSDPLAFGASYSGFTGGSPSASLPLLMKGNFGFNTWFSVQNVGSADTNVTVTYDDGVVAGPTLVKPGAAAKFEQVNETHAAGWVGSATVSSSAGDIAISSLEVGPTTLFAYNGFGAGATNPVMPLVQENSFGYVTGVQVQNLGSAASDVTIAYTPGPGQPGSACEETRTVQPGKSASFALYVFTTFADINPSSLKSENCTAGQTFVGSAKVTGNTGAVPLVAIVNQLNSGANKGAAYNAFDPAGGTEEVVFPLIMDRNYGYFTGFNVVNVGSAAIAKASLVCTVTGKDGVGNPVTQTFSPPSDLAPGSGWNQVNLNTLANGFVGSASCKATGASMVGSVNEVNVGGAGDAFLVYEGTNP